MRCKTLKKDPELSMDDNRIIRKVYSEIMRESGLWNYIS